MNPTTAQLNAVPFGFTYQFRPVRKGELYITANNRIQESWFDLPNFGNRLVIWKA